MIGNKEGSLLMPKVSMENSEEESKSVSIKLNSSLSLKIKNFEDIKSLEEIAHDIEDINEELM
jgi:hypothetical protein